MPVNISANFLEINPVIDGVININEYSYSEPYFVNFTQSGFYWDGGIKRLNATYNDHSGFMYLGYTNTTLHMAFNMSDNFIDSNDIVNCFQNDGVEIFINGDMVNNDFGYSGNREGFQLVVDAVGNKMTNVANQNDLNNTMWNVSTTITSSGYIIEVGIPLYLIDTLDGPGERAPTINSTIKINIAFNDNDRIVSGQDAQGALWLNTSRESPYTVKEAGWPINLFFLDYILTTPTTTPTTTQIINTTKNDNINTESSKSQKSSNQVYIYAPICSILGVLIIVAILYIYKNKNNKKNTKINEIFVFNNKDNIVYDINTVDKDNKIYATPNLGIYDLYNTSIQQNTNNAYDIANSNSNASYDLAQEKQNISYDMAINISNDNNELYGFIGNMNSYLDIDIEIKNK
jgi:hypothetical protein